MRRHGASDAEVERIERRIEQLVAVARAGGCRVAISEPLPASPGHWMSGCMPGSFHFSPAAPVRLDVQFIMLGPGETPPDVSESWAIY